MRNVVITWLFVLAWSLSFSSCSLRGRDREGHGARANAAASARARGGAARDRTEGAAMWGANYFPNIPLVSHQGEKVRFFDLIKDKVVAVNFIYTKCADSCPMETARMRDVAKVLGDRLGKDVFFYSISIDPENDTPERLKEYADLWHTGPGWTFYTGTEEDVTLLRKKLGVYEADRKKRDHSLSMVIGNQATGRWMKRSPGENPYILANELGQWLHNWKLKGKGGDRDYANAPEVRNISGGEELFRARCASCHTVGGGDTFAVDERRVGPDLFEVSKRRERAWLERWIMAPDKMIAENDPTATQLLAAYKIIMPNMRLNRTDTAAVLKYLDEASAEAAKNRSNYVRASTTAPAGEGAAQAVPAAAPAAGPLPDRALVQTRSSLDAYETMRARFAADDLEGARAQSAAVADAALNAAADAGPSRTALITLAEAARAVGGAADVDAARLSFGELSKSVIALMVADPKLREGRFLFLCPMASGYKKWVQTGSTLNNPYWGKRMLTCGKQLSDWAILHTE